MKNKFKVYIGLSGMCMCHLCNTCPYMTLETSYCISARPKAANIWGSYAGARDGTRVFP